MINNVSSLLQLTETAANKIKSLILDEKNTDLKLRVYITSGGCGGFQYGFALDNQINDSDIIIENYGVILVVDSTSLQYLIGGSVDYIEDLKGSHFIIINPNAKGTCGCGLSFSI